MNTIQVSDQSAMPEISSSSSLPVLKCILEPSNRQTLRMLRSLEKACGAMKMGVSGEGITLVHHRLASSVRQLTSWTFLSHSLAGLKDVQLFPTEGNRYSFPLVIEFKLSLLTSILRAISTHPLAILHVHPTCLKIYSKSLLLNLNELRPNGVGVICHQIPIELLSTSTSNDTLMSLLGEPSIAPPEITFTLPNPSQFHRILSTTSLPNHKKIRIAVNRSGTLQMHLEDGLLAVSLEVDQVRIVGGSSASDKDLLCLYGVNVLRDSFCRALAHSRELAEGSTNTLISIVPDEALVVSVSFVEFTTNTQTRSSISSFYLSAVD